MSVAHLHLVAPSRPRQPTTRRRSPPHPPPGPAAPHPVLLLLVVHLRLTPCPATVWGVGGRYVSNDRDLFHTLVPESKEISASADPRDKRGVEFRVAVLAV
jgi:hypothetical protein